MIRLDPGTRVTLLDDGRVRVTGNGREDVEYAAGSLEGRDYLRAWNERLIDAFAADGN